MPARELPHYWTPEQVRQILVALPAGQPWLFALLLWRAARLRSAGLYVTSVKRTERGATIVWILGSTVIASLGTGYVAWLIWHLLDDRRNGRYANRVTSLMIGRFH